MSVVVLTGANRGIGLELAKQLAERGEQVVAAVRNSTPELDALGVRVIRGVEVTSDEGVANLAERISEDNIGLLINNAGVLIPDSLHNLDYGNINKQLEVNSVAPLRVTAALRDHLGYGSKVAIITSRMGSLADNTSGGMYGYRMSKAAVNSAGVSLANDLKGDGIAVVLLHPGHVKTDMTGGSGNLTAAEAARGLLERIDALSIENTGKFFHQNGEELPW